MKNLSKYISEKLCHQQVDEKLIIIPSQVNEKLVVIPSQVNEKLVVNKDYNVTNYNSFTDINEIYVILFDNFGRHNYLMFNVYNVYDHNCDPEKSIIKFSSAVSIFNQWGISATAMYDEKNDIAYISNDKNTYVIFSDKNIEKLESLLSLMKKLINTDYSIKSILDELDIDNGKTFIKTDMYQTYKFDKNDQDNEYKRTKAYLKQHLDYIKKNK